MNPDDGDACIAIRTAIDPASSKHVNRLFGQIFLQIGREAFPQQGWRDNIGAVLRMWARALIDLRKTAGGVRWYFMEGPYYIEIGPGPECLLSLSFIEDREHPSVRATATVPYDELCGTLRESIRKALDDAHANQLVDGDIEYLSRSFDQL
jgi:hypothetical protein